MDVLCGADNALLFVRVPCNVTRPTGREGGKGEREGGRGRARSDAKHLHV